MGEPEPAGRPPYSYHQVFADAVSKRWAHYNYSVVDFHLRRWGGFTIILFGAGLLLWGGLPARHESQHIAFEYAQSVTRPGWDSLKPPPPIQNGQITIQWPERIRLGDTGRVEMWFSPHENSNSLDCTSQVTSSEQLTLLARLELPNVPVAPASELAQVVTACQQIYQAWSVRPAASGRYAGIVWLHLAVDWQEPGFEPRLPILTTALEFETSTLMGLAAPQVRLIGILAVLIGLVINIDLIIPKKG